MHCIYEPWFLVVTCLASNLRSEPYKKKKRTEQYKLPVDKCISHLLEFPFSTWITIFLSRVGHWPCIFKPVVILLCTSPPLLPLSQPRKALNSPESSAAVLSSLYAPPAPVPLPFHQLPITNCISEFGTSFKALELCGSWCPCLWLLTKNWLRFSALIFLYLGWAICNCCFCRSKNRQIFQWFNKKKLLSWVIQTPREPKAGMSSLGWHCSKAGYNSVF